MRNPPLVLARNPELVQTHTRDTSTAPSRTRRLGSVPAQPAKSVFHTTCFQPRQRVFPFRVQDAWTKGSSGDWDLTDILVTPYHRHESTLHAARPMLLLSSGRVQYAPCSTTLKCRFRQVQGRSFLGHRGLCWGVARRVGSWKTPGTESDWLIRHLGAHDIDHRALGIKLTIPKDHTT